MFPVAPFPHPSRIRQIYDELHIIPSITHSNMHDITELFLDTLSVAIMAEISIQHLHGQTNNRLTLH
jgi:hypothetical protein